ncbi:MAG: acyl-CoA desaturase [Gemmatimonadetes bacterium]|jgi:linoleoyl-CoA desaturase|nr:acyl-CoA desaturase [Gemmatimonadota bacterium]MBT6146655.1 acyl-CoA desaturase [Gemmatimonadota bacterium]MBT7863911.1 acyl-CoA desaturase [Gemmatimonadota bacterium]
MTERVQYVARSPFYPDLKERVDGYFATTQLPRTGTWRLFLKTLVCITGYIAGYCYLVWFAQSWEAAIAGVIFTGVTMCLVGFNVMHDGAHGAYSSSARLNWLMGYTLDLMGGSNYLWRQKHNGLHHTYTNVDELDRDLQSSGLMRLSPDQQWLEHHRWQPWYALPLYSLHTFFWVIYRDYSSFFGRRAGPVQLRQPRMGETIAFLGAKLFYYAYALILPAWIHGPWKVLLAYTAIHLIAGVVLSIVFQLAHSTEDVTFPTPDADSGEIEDAWAVSQVETTANFAHGNHLLSWCIGGLNYQIEHHLFPRISHVHYPALSQIVRQACADHDVHYFCQPTLRASIAAHFRFLRQMAKEPDSGPDSGVAQHLATEVAP